MARVKIEIICKLCGNSFIHEKKCYNRTAAESYEEWAIDNIDTCPSCYYKQKKAEEERKKAEEAASFSESMKGVELSELVGTEKQIKWASDIRYHAVGNILKYGPSPEFFVLVNSKTDSKWWIENRDYFVYPDIFCKLLRNK